jgi:hypothetical protein
MVISDILRFLAKGITIIAIICLLRLTLENNIDWGLHQDPRRELLWADLSTVTADIFILGDSEFCSYYVSDERETLWMRLQELTGRRVFPGALNGADIGDFIDAAKLLAKEQKARRKGIIILNIIPTRLLSSPIEKQENRNYSLADRLDSSRWSCARRWILQTLFVSRIELGKIPFRRSSYFASGDHRFRVWYKDGNFARNRYEGFLSYARNASTDSSFEWIEKIRRIANDGDFELLCVLTPINIDLIKAYSYREDAFWLISKLNAARSKFKQYAAENSLEIVDIADNLQADDFADLIHTNAHGTLLEARSIAQALEAMAEFSPLTSNKRNKETGLIPFR